MNELLVNDLFAIEPMDEMFRGFMRPWKLEPGQRAPQIKLDLSETEANYTIKADIPGVKKEDIDVRVEGNQVTIGAEVKKETEQKEGDRVLRSERYYGSVYRSFTVPVDLDEAASTAKYENGVLELTLAKKPAIAGRKLTVQ